MADLLMTFVKNPALGKAKTRLAQTVGDEKALEIYLQLLKYTQNTIRDLPVTKQIHYSDFADSQDFWENEIFQKTTQIAGGLGEKMLHAFSSAFSEGFDSVLIVGSDCPELTQEILQEAFDKLKTHDVVFGPAEDGGYYLLGMNQLVPELFQNKQWSTDSVLPSSVADCQKLGLTHALLPQLSDIDYEEDWLRFKDRLEV